MRFMPVRNAGWLATCRRTVLVLVAAIGLSSKTAHAAGARLDLSGSFAIRWWTIEDGLPETPLTGVATAPDGAVWCTSRTRLTRFDGRRWTALPEPVASQLHAQLGDFRGIAMPPTGELWLVGSEGAAVHRPVAAPAHVTLADWTVYRHPDGAFWHVFFDRAGKPHFYGTNVFTDFDGTRLVARELPASRPPFTYYGVVPDRRTDDLWIWAYGDARRIHDNFAHPDAGPLEGRIIDMAAGDSGIWAGLVDLQAGTVDGAAVYRDGAWREYPTTSKPRTATREGHICEGPDGTVWLATHASMLALRNGTWQTVVDGLPDFSLTTQRLATDRCGVLWAACKGGLLSINRTTLQTTPLPPCRVTFERRDGSLVAGIPGAVVQLAPQNLVRYGQLGHRDVVAELPAGFSPTAIAETSDGTLFVGTSDSFLYVIRDGTARLVTQTPGIPLEVRNVNALVCDADDVVWAGTDNGLARYNRRRNCFDFVDAFITPTPLPVLGLLAEPDGSLLVAVQGRGIERLTPNGSMSQEVPAALMPGKRIVRFLRTPDHTIWAGGDAGLLRWDTNGHMALFDTRHGLAERAIVQLSADDEGRLWLALRDGHIQGIRITDLDALADRRRSFVRGIVLGPLDGIGETEFLGGLIRTDPRRLLATTSAGAVTIDTDRLAAAGTGRMATISIEHTTIDGQPRFEWADVTTHEFDLPLYQTRLSGVDNDWSVPTSDTTRTFASIPPGPHRFEVRHLRGDALDDAPTGALDIAIPAPFWRTPWFLAASGVGVAALAAAGGTAVSRALARRRIAQLEREQERQRDRARIARDIHDSLGAGLTQIAMMSDLMRRGSRNAGKAAGDRPHLDEALDEMFRSAQSLTRAVDEIVWAVNPANDTLVRFCTFIAHDVEDMARSGDIDLQIDVDENIPDLVLSATTRHHLCMIVREAVANVLKHARATVLGFSLRCRGGTLDMTIDDDGVGFATTAPAAEGHDGLANMRARVDELGGSLSIHSTQDQGTHVAVQVPLATQAPLPTDRPRVRLRPADDTDHDTRRTG